MDICTLIVSTTVFLNICPSVQRCEEANGKQYCQMIQTDCHEPSSHYECVRPDGSRYNAPVEEHPAFLGMQ